MATVLGPDINVFWKDPYLNAQIQSKRAQLEGLLAASKTYRTVALDIKTFGEPYRQNLLALIRYFYKAASEVCDAAKSDAGLISDSESNGSVYTNDEMPTTNTRTDALSQCVLELEEELKRIKAIFIWLNEGTEIDSLVVPHAQVLELFMEGILRSLANSPSPNLATFQTAIRDTFTVRELDKRIAKESRNSTIGLPRVVFVCMKHKLAACSADQWGAFKGFDKEMRTLRNSRYANVDMKEEMQHQREKVSNRFDSVSETLHKTSDIQLRAKKQTLDKNEYNEFVRAMYRTPVFVSDNGDKPLVPEIGFCHFEESARAFWAANKKEKMFTETSRCWKCRFLYLYDVPQKGAENDTGLKPEEPSQAAWRCNEAWCCAEDLCHYRCWDARDFYPLPYLNAAGR